MLTGIVPRTYGPGCARHYDNVNLPPPSLGLQASCFKLPSPCALSFGTCSPADIQRSQMIIHFLLCQGQGLTVYGPLAIARRVGRVLQPFTSSEPLHVVACASSNSISFFGLLPRCEHVGPPAHARRELRWRLRRISNCRWERRRAPG
jgi:hypothetical protein